MPSTQTYTVASDRLVGHKRGSQVQAEDFAEASLAALVAAGHLVPDEPAPPKATSAISKKEQ